jgi:hypothetical protein
MSAVTRVGTRVWRGQPHTIIRVVGQVRSTVRRLASGCRWLGMSGSGFVFVVGGDISHDVVLTIRGSVLRRFVCTRISEKEAQVSNGIVAFGGFKTSDGILETIFSNVGVEAATLHGLTGDANDLLDATRGIHDSQGSSETVQE